MRLLTSIPVFCYFFMAMGNNFKSTPRQDIFYQIDSSYGYTPDNPIKVGGGESGPKQEREYLSSLSGPNGELIGFYRIGSCCAFKTRKGLMGFGLLDKYAVYQAGKTDTVILYLNMYDKHKNKIKAPTGFLLKD